MNAEIKTPINVWQPVAGESLIGIIVGTQQVTGIYGDNRQVLIKDKRGVDGFKNPLKTGA